MVSHELLTEPEEKKGKKHLADNLLHHLQEKRE